jgi:hypothetical protein
MIIYPTILVFQFSFTVSDFFVEISVAYPETSFDINVRSINCSFRFIKYLSFASDFRPLALDQDYQDL